jgi:cation transport ATPase
MPDVLTLVQLAELFGVTVNDLLVDPDEILEKTDNRMEQAMSAAVERATKKKATKRIILGLSSLLVWFVALLLFVVLSTLDFPKSWIAFIYAIPADAIVRLSLRSAWKDFRHNQGLVSMIMWGVLISVYMTIMLFVGFNFWKVFLLGIPGQLAIFLAFRLRKHTKED